MASPTFQTMLAAPLKSKPVPVALLPAPTLILILPADVSRVTIVGYIIQLTK